MKQTALDPDFLVGTSGNRRRAITIRFDSDSSEDDDETTDNFKNEIGMKGEKEDIEDSVTWALDNLEDLILQIANDDPVDDNVLGIKKAQPTSLDMEREADIAEGECVTSKISSTSQRQVKGAATATHKTSNTNNCEMDGPKGVMMDEKEVSCDKIDNLNSTKSINRTRPNFIKSLELKETTLSNSNQDSKVHQNVENICKAFKETLSARDLDKIMGKVQPLLNQIKDMYDSQLSNSFVEITPSSGSGKSTSGPPPPAPPPPPPPADIPKFKIRKPGATLTANHSNGSVSNIEIRIKKSNKDDMLSQLQKRLQNRQKRQTLAMKYANLDITKA